MRMISSFFGGLMTGLIALASAPVALAQVRSPSVAEQAYYQLEANVFDRGKIQDAVAKLKAAQSSQPNDPWVYMGASLATLVAGYKIGDWYEQKTFAEGTADRALVLALKAKDMGPANAQCYAHLARILILKGDYDQAKTLLDRASELDSGSFYPWYFRGVMAERNRDARQARAFFDEAERRISYGHQAGLLNGHRQKVAKLSHEYGEQERLLQENIKRAPDEPQLYGNYARFLMEHKRYEEAIQYWEKAIAIGSYPEAVRRLEETRRLVRGAKSSDAH